MTDRHSPPRSRRFLRYRIRELLLITAIVGVVAGIYFDHPMDRSARATRQLFTAAANRDLEGVSQALEAGANVNVRDAKGRTALEYAVENKHLGIIDVLLRAGAYPLDVTVAVRMNDITYVRFLLDRGAHPVLGDCIENGNLEILELLLKLGARDGLQQAIASQHSEPKKLEIIKMLLQYGVEFDGLLDQAIRDSDAKRLELLRHYGAPYTPREAVAFNRLDDIKRMVQADPSILFRHFRDYASGYQVPLLGIALERRYQEMAHYLLEAGAPVNGVQYRDCSLLHAAVTDGLPDFVGILVSHGANVNVKDEWGDTPLHIAVRFGLFDCASELVESGADANLINAIKDTPLHLAVSRNNAQMVKLLLSSGADSSIRRGDGTSAFELARSRRKADIIQLLEKAQRAKKTDAVGENSGEQRDGYEPP